MQQKMYDVSVGLRPSMPVWPDNPGFEISPYQTLEEGADANVSVMKLGSHVGTHVDAPAHFIKGAPSVDTLPLDILIGEAFVFELQVQSSISLADLEVLDLRGRKRILFKTRNSMLWSKEEFTPDYVSFEIEAAEFLVRKGVKLVGIDYLSVGSYEDGVDVHHAFLESGIVVIEGLDLSSVSQGPYEIVCLPLKVIGADGAPARVVLRQ